MGLSGISLKHTVWPRRISFQRVNFRETRRPQCAAMRKMLRLMMKKQLPAACPAGLIFAGLVLAAAACSAQAPAQPQTQTPAQPQSSQSSQTTAAPGTVPVAAPQAVYTGPKYTNRFEIYGGLLLMNGQAGQILAKRYNMGGGEGMFTYWLGTPHSDSFIKRHLGLVADYRFGAGTTPVVTIDNINRVLVMQHIGSGGFQIRWLKNRYVALDLHGLAGTTYGIFNHATQEYTPGTVGYCPAAAQPGQQANLNLYCNGFAPWGAAGGSIDFNESGKLAIRLSPDMTFEHFGTETREFFGISMGAMYRFGKNQ